MSYETIIVNRPAEKILEILFNRPRQLNALDRRTIVELHQALIAFEDSDDEFLMLSGTGRAFCFGADFHEFENPDALPDLLALFQEMMVKIYHCSKLTVAVLNGFATGAGLDLALACDFRIAAEKVKLGEAYISMGLVPDGGGTYFLPRLAGTGRALELLIKGEAIPAEEARTMGLVHHVFPLKELRESALKFVLELSGKPKTARQLIKRLVKNPRPTLEDSLRREREAQLVCFQDPEHLKLVEDFLKKRKKED